MTSGLPGIDASTEELVASLSDGPAEAAAGRLRALVRAEDRLVTENVVKPYLDKVPKVVTQLEPARLAALIDLLPTEDALRALFGNYTRIPDDVLRDLLGRLRPSVAAQLVDAMAVGVDPPREMSRILARAPGSALAAPLALVHPAAAVRLLRDMEPEEQRRVVLTGGPAQAARIAGVLLAEESRVADAWAARLLSGLSTEDRREAERALTVPARERLADVAEATAAGDPSSHELRDRVVTLADGPVDEAAAALRQMHPVAAARSLRPLGAARAAELLARLAEDDPELAADLLEATSPPLLLRRPVSGTTPAWWLRECPAAAILEALDVERPAVGSLLAGITPDRGALFLEHVSEERRGELAERMAVEQEAGLVLSFEALGVGRGRRTSRRMDHGLRWVRISEELDTGAVVKPVIVDLLEVDLDRTRLDARIAASQAAALPADRTAEVFEVYRAENRRPSGQDFARFGLTQLSRAVERDGAIAAINGNFYFDYGHYINGVTLGVDIARVPGLYFGDPIGWFVADGRELIPPAFNRAAGVVTEDGNVHIDRVFMTAIVLPDGRRVTWERLNAPKEGGRIQAFTSLWGYRTEGGDSHVDVAIGRGAIAAVSPGGEQVIPLTGLVLSIPRERSDLLSAVAPGRAVTVENNFPPSRGRVVHAMACGPSLVRDGVADTDFEAEDFGQQALRGRTLILGTVSGTAYGFGRSAVSGGMTFGEMGQLCLDLGVDHAYALDGGGSSSLVARDGGVPRVLNTPTGGADVSAGEERYINTYWLVHERERDR
jgi:flagellar motility protein MotE (MotC chaperone)